mmetsp:Transcript_5204/g.12955  ORF Transcript_5204/g.12955 Transcript_5204/m.12955 type:complete len:100 (-) Transcript_5204:439-738(-)
MQLPCVAPCLAVCEDLELRWTGPAGRFVALVVRCHTSFAGAACPTGRALLYRQLLSRFKGDRPACQSGLCAIVILSQVAGDWESAAQLAWPCGAVTLRP